MTWETQCLQPFPPAHYFLHLLTIHIILAVCVIFSLLTCQRSEGELEVFGLWELAADTY